MHELFSEPDANCKKVLLSRMWSRKCVQNTLFYECDEGRKACEALAHFVNCALETRWFVRLALNLSLSIWGPTGNSNTPMINYEEKLLHKNSIMHACYLNSNCFQSRMQTVKKFYFLVRGAENVCKILSSTNVTKDVKPVSRSLTSSTVHWRLYDSPDWQ